MKIKQRANKRTKCQYQYRAWQRKDYIETFWPFSPQTFTTRGRNIYFRNEINSNNSIKLIPNAWKGPMPVNGSGYSHSHTSIESEKLFSCCLLSVYLKLKCTLVFDRFHFLSIESKGRKERAKQSSPDNEKWGKLSARSVQEAIMDLFLLSFENVEHLHNSISLKVFLERHWHGATWMLW